MEPVDLEGSGLTQEQMEEDKANMPLEYRYPSD
jgi:hypothetical protein